MTPSCRCAASDGGRGCDKITSSGIGGCPVFLFSFLKWHSQAKLVGDGCLWCLHPRVLHKDMPGVHHGHLVRQWTQGRGGWRDRHWLPAAGPRQWRVRKMLRTLAWRTRPLQENSVWADARGDRKCSKWGSHPASPVKWLFSMAVRAGDGFCFSFLFFFLMIYIS